MYSGNKEKTQNDNISENEFQTEDISENYEMDTEENHERGDDEVDLVIDQDLTNLLTEAGPASHDVKKKRQQIDNRENMLGSILGSIIVLQNMNTFAKFVKFFYSDHPCPTGQG